MIRRHTPVVIIHILPFARSRLAIPRMPGAKSNILLLIFGNFIFNLRNVNTLKESTLAFFQLTQYEGTSTEEETRPLFQLQH